MNLQLALANVDLNIAPLQDNVFTNCKSELKYFEAAAAGTVTIASPTYAFRNSIVDGVNGFFASPIDWYDCSHSVSTGWTRPERSRPPPCQMSSPDTRPRPRETPGGRSPQLAVRNARACSESPRSALGPRARRGDRRTVQPGDARPPACEAPLPVLLLRQRDGDIPRLELPRDEDVIADARRLEARWIVVWPEAESGRPGTSGSARVPAAGRGRWGGGALHPVEHQRASR